MSQAGWAVPTFPFEPRDSAPTLTEVPDAILTRMRRGVLRTIEEPKKWMRGAVYDADRRLVVASQKVSGLLDSPMAMADQGRVPAQPRARLLEGTWLYGGNWIQHFGHFFTESLTPLWPEGLDVQGLVFHGYMLPHSGQRPWQKQLLRLTAYAGLPVEIIEDEGLRAEHLIVPDRPVVLNGWAHPEARSVWQTMAANAGATATRDPDGDRVFLSRSGFNQNFRETGRGKRVRTEPDRDADLDRVFADAGFRIVAPEELTVRQQVRLAAGASVLAGVSGSALHLSAFAPSGLRVIELGDRRSPTEHVPMQRIVDHVCDHPAAFVPYDVPTGQLPEVLGELGVSG